MSICLCVLLLLLLCCLGAMGILSSLRDTLDADAVAVSTCAGVRLAPPWLPTTITTTR